MVVCLERGADLHMARLMLLPLIVSCFSKIQIGFTFLAPAHLGSPGKGPLNVCSSTSFTHSRQHKRNICGKLHGSTVQCQLCVLWINNNAQNDAQISLDSTWEDHGSEIKHLKHKTIKLPPVSTMAVGDSLHEQSDMTSYSDTDNKNIATDIYIH